MQPLRPASKAAEAVPPAECARGMLNGLPGVMWFIRQEMRRHRVRRLSVPQFRTLVLIDRYPAASLSCVGEHLGTALSTASRIVSGLVSKGFVWRREGQKDRRQVSLELTSAGREALDAARKETHLSLERAISHLDCDQRVTVAKAMRIIQDVFASGATADVSDDKTGDALSVASRV
jgi:DNA-binding MarR family transcriptional regulator